MLRLSDFFDEEPEQVVEDLYPPSCSYCGSDTFSGLEDTGRGDRAICAHCGGAMLRPEDGVWAPAGPNATHNHPSTAGDPTQHGAAGVVAIPGGPVYRNNLGPNALNMLASTDDSASAYKRELGHQAPDEEDNSPLHHLDKVTFPSNVYTHPHYYQNGHDGDKDAINVAKSVRGKPDADVHIYRALPAEHAHHGIQPGDWVSTSADYARQHGYHHDDPEHDWPVVHAVVPAKHLHTEGDLLEYGYNGSHAPKADIHFEGGHHQQIEQHDDGSIAAVRPSAAKQASLEKLAHWSDVVAKARRLRREGSVHIVVAVGTGADAVVRGDHGVYTTLIAYQPGTRKTASWECGCKYAEYADGPRWRNRPCSHVLAVRFEVQSRGMFGRQVRPDGMAPEWVKTSSRDWAQLKEDQQTNDARKNSYDYGVDVPDWGLPTEWCPQCGGGGCGHCGATGQVLADGPTTASPMPDESAAAGDEIRSSGLTASSHTSSVDEEAPAAPTVAGLVIKAGDTGRVLMLQRGLSDEDDPARGMWEFPGGHLEEGDETSLHGAIREWEEEVGQPIPQGGSLKHIWESPNGVYVGHVLLIPSEKALTMHDGRVIPNPDDPDGDEPEQAAWWDVDHAKDNPALREECKDSPWEDIAQAGMTKEAATWDALDTLQDSSWPANKPDHSDSENPASTGPLTGQDPAGWDHLGEQPSHMGPTDGMTFSGSLSNEEDLMFDPRLTYATPVEGSASAKAFEHTAMRNFTFAEQQDLINEGKGIKARNFGDLNLDGTHYVALQSAIDAAGLSDGDEVIFI